MSDSEGQAETVVSFIIQLNSSTVVVFWLQFGTVGRCGDTAAILV